MTRIKPQQIAGRIARSSSKYLMLLVAGTLFCGPVSAAVKTSLDTVDGRLVESIAVKRSESKACVVFENGLRGTMDSWNGVIDSLGSDVSIFAYNRPGYGRSEQAKTPRDGNTIVEELRRTLKQKGLAPPYILVGHSLGGLYMQLFARRYPEEVSGLVLVDALYPRIIKKPADFPFLTRVAKNLFFSKTVSDEIDQIYNTGEQMVALAPLDAKPIVQLINQPTGATAISLDFGVFNDDERTGQFVRGLYPNSKKVILDSDHQMQKESPVEVIAAIKEVVTLQAARTR